MISINNSVKPELATHFESGKYYLVDGNKIYEWRDGEWRWSTRIPKESSKI